MSGDGPVLALRGVTKAYGEGDAVVEVLHGLDLEVAQGEFVAIMGPSGSGKSTLLNILGCLDRPTEGEYLLDGEDVAGFSDDQLSLIRNARIGFVFQSFNLIPQLTVLENVEVPLFYRARGHGEGWSARRNSSRPSASPTGSATVRRSSRAASASAWRSRARS